MLDGWQYGIPAFLAACGVTAALIVGVAIRMAAGTNEQNQRVGLPRWSQHVTWASAAGIVTSTAGMIAGIFVIVRHADPNASATGAAIIGIGGVVGTWLGNIGSVLARDSGVGAANEVGERAGVVPPLISEADQPAQGSSVAANSAAPEVKP